MAPPRFSRRVPSWHPIKPTGRHPGGVPPDIFLEIQMRYLFVLIAYLVLVPFSPKIMGGLGLLVVAWWAYRLFKAIFSSPPIELEPGERAKPEHDSKSRLAPPPEPEPEPMLHVQEPTETDEEFLTRMRFMNS
jgi:hypothetical protein